MVREILKIYTDNGLGSNNPKFKDIEISEYQYKSSRMGMPELTATLMWGTCLDEEWTGKEYVVLNSERFYIRHTPSSSKSNTDARYKHDISFTSEVAEILGNTYYEDAVPSYSATYDKPCTNSTKFTFYGTIHEFCARLNCGFIKAGIGDTILDTKTKLTPDDKPIGDGYCVIVDEAGIADPDKTYNFEWEDKYLWEAITEGYTVTEIPFERRGKEIIFGAVPVVVEHKFKYGHDNELLSVSKKNANAKVVNRITMSGSSENIPYYYPNETEYGHISISEKTGNNVLTADKISIENTAQMLSRINAGQMAVLKKYEKNKDDEYDTAVVIKSYASAIESDVLEPYTLGDTLKFEHKPYGWGEPYKFWNIQVNFEVLSRGFVTCDSVAYQVWMKLQSPVLNSLGPLPVSLTNLDNMTLRDVTNGKDISEQIRIKDEGTSFGILTEGDYEFKFSVRIEEGHAGSPVDADFFCYLESVTLSFEKNKPAEKEGYYWAVGDKEYAGVGSLGVKISIPITDDMIGDGFGWEASGRMPFQTNLVPPKFRSTLGAERFYNAINNTYNDPDTGNKYTFPNPFVKGAPNEYIHKNEDAKPTIEGVCNAVQRRGTNNNLVYDDNGNPVYQLLGEIADIAYDADDNDSLKADSSEENDKNDSLKYEHSFFYIKLNIFNGTYGFDLFKHASQTDAMTIQMREGSCNGCKFKIQAVRFTDETGLETYKNPVIVRNGVPVGVVSEKGIKESDLDPTQQNTQTNSIWICVQKDAETFGVIMPNKSHIFKPKVGDKFNIINIDLPQAYILAAEQRLEDEGIRFMADNNEEKFTFDISASRIFFADNPTILAQIDEYSKIKVEYNGKTYEQYVNQLSIDCKNNETLPNIGIDLTDTLAVGQSFLDSVAERASSLVSNATTMGGNIGGGGGMSATVADRRYISKQKSDRTPYKVASDTAFEVGEFINGASGAILMRDPVTGQTYLEVDKIRARMKAIFAELEIAKENSIGGAFDITPGGGINITFVEELTDSYRCYFKAREEDKGADCRFVVGDQARCSERNISNGLINDASNRYYWRLVTAVNNRESYIDLSKADCDAGSDAPVAGDTVVHLGNRNNKERQSAIVLSTVDASAPSVTLYNGIDHYSLDGKAVVEYGVDKSKNPPEPFFNCYGRFYFGPKGGNSYLKFEPSVGKLIFSGELINISHLNGKELDQYIKDVVPPVTQEDIEGYVNAIVDPQIENIQNQIDGVIETWFYNGVPTLSNYPASEWNTDALKIAHLGDLYYDNDTGTAYRFSQDNNGNYYWNTITDDAITKALAAAKNAQDTADGKRRTFTAQPVPPYDEGDIWTNATYGTYSNDILRCITKKAKGEAFNISDWTLASKYTDDSALNTFIQGYESTIGDIKTQIDGKAQTWYQATDPSSAWKTDAQKAEHKGDLWYNTTNGTTWYWDGSQWKQQDVPDAVFDKIDGKADIFVSKPTGGYHQNDLWFLEADYTLSDGAHKAGTLAVALHDMGASFNFNDWAKKDRYTDDTKANQAIEEIGGYQYLKQAIANGASLFQGGLILSGLIKLGEWDLTDRNNPVQTEVWAGMNGIYNHPKTIASWWGGDMVDKFYNDSVTPRPTPLASGYAQALIRMDGTGYLAGGNIKWDSDGSGSVAGGNISWNALGSLTLGNGIKIDLGSGNETTLGGIQASLESITNLFAKFSDNFVPMVRLANGNVVETNWGNINNNNPLYAVKSVKGFYSEEFISARGKNDNGSQGGATQLRMLEDVNINDNALASGQSLVYDGSKWVNMKAGLNTTELAQYLTDNNYAKKSDMPTLAGYATEQWVDDKGYALDSVLTAHTGNTTIHITSAERTLWNTTATNLSAILGSDSDTIINKWEEVVAFLDTYTEADTLATLLSNKADKSTTLAGYGITNAYTKDESNGKYVTALGTNGNYLTWTKNGSTSNITVPYATQSIYLRRRGVPTGETAVTAISDTEHTLALYTGVVKNTEGLFPNNNNANAILTLNRHSGNYYSQLGFSSDGNMYYRSFNNAALDTTTGWRTVLDSGNYATMLDGHYVTLATAQTITGKKIFNTNNNSVPLIVSRMGSPAEALAIGVDDGTTYFTYTNDEFASSIRFTLKNTDIENSDGSRASEHSFILSATQTALNASLDGSVKAGSFVKYGGTASQFLKADGTVDGTAYLPKQTFDTFEAKFNSMFEKEPDGKGGFRIKAKLGFYSESFVSAKGLNSNANSGGNFGLWSDNTWTTEPSASDALGAVVGKNKIDDLQNQINNLSTVNPYSLTIQRNGSNVAVYNGASAVTANISVPTNVTDLTNTTLLKIDGSNGTRAGVNALINLLDSGTSTPTDNDYYIAQYTNGNDSSVNNHTFLRRKTSSLWNYIKGKADSVYQPIGNYLTSITKAQVEGVLTGNISTHTHSYLPLSGGVLKNGTNQAPLTIDTDSTSEVGMRFCTSGTAKGWLGYNSTYGTNLYNYAKGWYLGLKDDGTLYYSGGTIWHSSNDGSGSGLDADLLDGKHDGELMAKKYNYTLYKRSNGSALGNYTKIGHLQFTKDWENSSCIINVVDGVKVDIAGILSFRLRSTDVVGTDYVNMEWLSLSVPEMADALCLVKIADREYDIYWHNFSTYNSLYFYIIGHLGNALIEPVTNENFDTITPTYTSSLGGYVANATSATSANKLATTQSYSAWGQTFWANGVPKSVSGDLNNVGSISASGNLTTSKTTSTHLAGNQGQAIINSTARAGYTMLAKMNSTNGVFTIGSYLTRFELYYTSNSIISAGSNGFTHRVSLIDEEGVTTVTKLKIGNITLEDVNGNLHINKGVYSDSFVSAKGINPDGASGGGLIHSVYGFGDLNGTYDDSNLTDTFNAFTIKSIYNGLQTHTHSQYVTQNALNNACDGVQSWVTSQNYATTSQLTNGSVTKVGTATKGGTSQPIYLNNGTPTAISATVGSATKPVYLNGGVITACTNTIPTDTNQLTNGAGFLTDDDIADYDFATFADLGNGSVTKVGTATKGSASLPIYLNAGVPTACTASTIFSALGNSGNDISMTVAGQNRTLTVGYASKAGQLNATKTIWGQNFNGTDNVSGAMSGVGSITMNGNLTNTYRGNGTYSKFVVEFGTMAINVEAPLSVNDISSDPIPVNFGWRGGSYALTLASNKNVGIGTTSPAYKLHVNGVAYASTGIFSDGYVSARGQNTSSDIRLKTNLTPFELALHQIANAPSVNFDWLEGSHDVGSIAQYWESVNPILTPKDPDGYLTLQYGKTALLSVITVAKETERLIVKADNHEERISRLEQSNRDLKRDNKALRQENKELKNKIFELERR